MTEDLDPASAAQILAGAGDPILVLDVAGTITWANDAVGTIGWTPTDLVGRSALDLLGSADAERALLALAALAAGHPPPSSAPYDVPTADGSTIECDVAGWVVGDPVAPEGLAVHIRPTQDSRILRHLLHRLLAGDGAEQVLEDMLELLYHRNPLVRVVVSFDDEDDVTRVVGHPLDLRLAGVGPAIDADDQSPWDRARSTGEELIFEGRTGLPEEVAATAAAAGLRDVWIVPVRPGHECLAVITLWSVEGGPSVQLDTYSVHLLAQLIELTLRWRRQTRDLERAATRDPLTGLPNRRAVAAFDAEGPRRDLGVLYVDLDRFKPVNDRLGHAAGDEVLCTVAGRLQSVVRPTDMVARLGGDEFGIVCPGCSADELHELAGRIVALVGDPIGVHDEVVEIGASIGAALGHDSAEPLLELADRALYGAKEAGRGAISWAEI